jgi:hypothetical protein
MIATLRAWLKRRRRARLEREERELSDLIERAYFCRCTSRFVDSVLTYRERKGYITERQQRALRVAVGSLERGM